jgi:hypothetical protein
MKKVYAIVNTIIVIAVIYWNYWSNSGGVNGKTVGELSNEYANLFTPAGYAFAIWGIIFFGLIVFCVNQLVLAFKGGENSESILQTGPWLALANIGNGAWLWFWLQEQTGASVLIMIFILFSLNQVILRLNMERWDAPISVITKVWWPICAYSGWIAVATIANIAAWLAKLNWSAGLTEMQWTVVMISVAGILNLIVLYTRSMREFALVGIWALLAIAARHWGEIALLQWVSLIWASVLAVAVSFHGLKNRKTNPFFFEICEIHKELNSQVLKFWVFLLLPKNKPYYIIICLRNY